MEQLHYNILALLAACALFIGTVEWIKYLT